MLLHFNSFIFVKESWHPVVAKHRSILSFRKFLGLTKNILINTKIFTHPICNNLNKTVMILLLNLNFI